jgi:hypothetical protein
MHCTLIEVSNVYLCEVTGEEKQGDEPACEEYICDSYSEEQEYSTPEGD